VNDPRAIGKDIADTYAEAMKIEQSRGNLLREHLAKLRPAIRERLVGHPELWMAPWNGRLIIYRGWWIFKQEAMVVYIDTSYALWPLFYIECKDERYWSLTRSITGHTDLTKAVKAW
jgi:hypothetical protein